MTAKVRCALCGKVIRDEDPAMAQMRTDGRLFAEGHVPVGLAGDPALDQGWWEVGSACLRKIAAAGSDGLKPLGAA